MREGYALDEVAPGHVSVVGSCENGNEPSVCMGVRGSLLTSCETLSSAPCA